MNGRIVKMARFLLACLGVLLFGVLAVSGMGAAVVGGVGLASAFTFAIPEDLKGSLTEADVKGLNALADQIVKHLENQTEKGMSQDDVNNAIKQSWDNYVKEYGLTKEKLTQLEEALKAQGVEITTLKNNGGKSETKSFHQQVHDWLKSDAFKKAALNEGKTRLEVKDAVPLSAYVTTAGALTTLIPAQPLVPELFRQDIDRTIHEAPRERNFLFQLFHKGNTNASVVIWFNRKNRQGSAEFVPEYGLKPLMSWTYERETASPYKVAVGVKISHEMLDDADFIEGEIRRVLNDELTTKIDDALLTGTGTSNQPEGIATWAGAYSGTGLDGTIASPNDADAIRAAMLQLRNVNFEPNVLVVTPTLAATLDLTKNANGNYMKTELDALLRPLRIIQSTKIEDGHFLLCDTSKFIVKTKGGLMMSTGWGINKLAEEQSAQGNEYATDFEVNAVTILLEQFFFAYHNNIDEASAIYDTFANVKTALTAAAGA